jgi:hypothetical protein
MANASAPQPPLTQVGFSIVYKVKRALFSSPIPNEFYFAETAWPPNRTQRRDPWQWDTPPRLIDYARVYSRYDASFMTIYDRHEEVHKKKLDLLKLGPKLFDGVSNADITLREILTCEMLLKNAHPDVCGYRGVIINDQGLVTGLIFDRYDWDLAETVAARHQFDGDACFQTVERAVKHLYSLGYTSMTT